MMLEGYVALGGIFLIALVITLFVYRDEYPEQPHKKK